MKLLLFSDLHTDRIAAESIVARSTQFDMLIGAGDFCHCRQRLDSTISILRKIETPTILVPGNSESAEELVKACIGWETAQVLHGNGTDIYDIPVFGIGGGIPVTPFGSWSYDFTEQEAEALLADCPEDGILVSHSPPKGVLDQSSRGQSLGSVAVRDCILNRRPRLVVCGHIHESAGKSATLGFSTVINAGPAGVSWDLK
ncbi:MAG: metallophosphoesterase family protein [Verrucomicrobiae bacterium]|nr:metallophosphoesterase family protein [Verrucomicrobiae bacterium]